MLQAPEVFDEKKYGGVTCKSDVYSFGIILKYALWCDLRSDLRCELWELRRDFGIILKPVLWSFLWCALWFELQCDLASFSSQCKQWDDATILIGKNCGVNCDL